ncbi:DUF7343 domain-containing protein [Halovivax asiaticus]|uniref:DUF7343 domain-containing protein n=1 Tax=Halovivax asiaticus TaxID=332953 RepID=UPI0006780400|nr:hypothetical protein [Halovivax asiaticus]
MAGWPVRGVQVLCGGVLLAALVVGALSLGSVSVLASTAPTATDGAVAPVDDSLGTGVTWQPQSNETDPTLVTEFDRVKTRIELLENSSASVTVTYRYLRSDNASATEWEDIRANVSASPGSYLAGERARWNDTVAAGQNATGREMGVSDFAIRTEEGMTPQAYGDVIVTFRWASFAQVEPKWIGAGDALSRFALEDRATLRIQWPDGYVLQDASPDPDDTDRRTVVGWHGEETDFLEDEPWIEVIHEGAPPETAGAAPDTSRSIVPFAVVGLTIVLLGVAVAWWFRRADADRRTDPDADQPAVPADEPSVAPSPDLMSNEERVLSLLRSNGGRMKQQTVVAELDWTEAKTSQVVGDLRDGGAVEVFRLGRENVLAVPDHEPGSAVDAETDVGGPATDDGEDAG